MAKLQAILKITPLTLTAPDDTVQLDLTGSTGNIVAWHFTKVKGGDGIIINPTQSKSQVTGLVPSDYLFEGRVTGARGRISTAEVGFTVSLPPAPTANAGQSQTIQLPGTLKLKGTAGGIRISTGWSGAGTIFNPNNLETDVTNLKAGTSDYTLTVIDQFMRKVDSTVTVTVLQEVVKSKTIFGAKVTNLPIEDQIAVAKKLGVDRIRISEVLTSYNGKSKGLDSCVAAGINPILNISYEAPGTVHQFARNLNEYKSLIDNFLGDQAHKIEVAVIENEPTVDAFWGNDPVSFYVELLKVAVASCKAHGVKVTDGALHPQGLTSGDSGTLLNAYKIIPLDYVNMHNSIGADYRKGTMIDTANTVRQQTGKPIMSNEFHLQQGVTDQAIKDFVQDIKEGGYVFGMVWGGDSSGKGGAPINIGTNLTHLGEVYRDAIK